jgi:hypothetical protein
MNRGLRPLCVVPPRAISSQQCSLGRAGQGMGGRGRAGRGGWGACGVGALTTGRWEGSVSRAGSVTAVPPLHRVVVPCRSPLGLPPWSLNSSVCQPVVQACKHCVVVLRSWAGVQLALSHPAAPAAHSCYRRTKASLGVGGGGPMACSKEPAGGRAASPPALQAPNPPPMRVCCTIVRPAVHTWHLCCGVLVSGGAAGVLGSQASMRAAGHMLCWQRRCVAGVATVLGAPARGGSGCLLHSPCQCEEHRT